MPRLGHPRTASLDGVLRRLTPRDFELIRLLGRHSMSVIVYARSRIHRNATDAGLTRRELKRLGVSRISVRDYTDESEVGDMVGTILDAVDEYQSRALGADIAYKMAAKAKRGGTPGRAKLGYITVIEEVDGRKIRAAQADPKRRSCIPHMFEMFATGEYSTPQLRDTVTKLGLRSRPTKQHPAGLPVRGVAEGPRHAVFDRSFQREVDLARSSSTQVRGKNLMSGCPRSWHWVAGTRRPSDGVGGWPS
jgi:hypothetical protein